MVVAPASLEGDIVLDGELVALDSQGRPSFKILQHILYKLLLTSFYALVVLNRDGELLVNFYLFPAGERCWKASFRAQ